MRKGWEYKKLGEVCCPKSKIQRATKCFGGSDEILYIDISSIDNSVQEVNSITSFTMSNAPSRAQQKVEYGDIIVSTVRPNLKNVAVIKQHNSNLIASSGFCVLRTTDDIERNYLFRYITSDIFTQHLMKLTTGANYPAVRDLDVRDSTIPLPPKSTQLAIVSELDKINELIRLKKEQLKDFDNLAQSLFYEMFGDPVENEKGWEVKKLNDICDVRDGTHDSPKYLQNSEYILITSKNIVNGSIDFENVNYISEEDYIKINKRSKVDNGDIIMPMIGTIGNPIIAHIDGTHKFCIKNVALIKFLADSTVNNMFIVNLMRCSSFSSYLLNQNKGGTQKFVALGAIRKLPIPLPPLSLQRLFAQRIEQIEREKSEVQKSIQDLETLLASRMQYWFE
mgnify:CR=1 FL=1